MKCAFVGAFAQTARRTVFGGKGVACNYASVYYVSIEEVVIFRREKSIGEEGGNGLPIYRGGSSR